MTGFDFASSRGDKTPLELFLAGVRNSVADLRALMSPEMSDEAVIEKEGQVVLR
jgi:hypothetical protein